MKTAKEYAEEINKNKPNMKDFLNLLHTGSERILENLKNTTNLAEQLLKAQLVLTTYKTHRNYYVSKSTYNDSFELVHKHITNGGVAYKFNCNKVQILEVDNFTYRISTKFPENQIAAHLTDVKQYLTRYLWNKIRTVNSKAEFIKKIEPNVMSLKLFEHHLKSLKKLQSTEALEYFKTLKDPSFDPIREQFVEAIFTKCKPSISLQRDLLESWRHQTMTLPNQNANKVSKHMILDRDYLKDLSKNLGIPISPIIMDDRDSNYKPFITKVMRDTTTEPHQVEYLFSSMLILQTANSIEPNPVYKYFADCLKEHLSHKDYGDEIAKLKTIHISIQKTIETLKDW